MDFPEGKKWTMPTSGLYVDPPLPTPTMFVSWLTTLVMRRVKADIFSKILGFEVEVRSMSLSRYCSRRVWTIRKRTGIPVKAIYCVTPSVRILVLDDGSERVTTRQFLSRSKDDPGYKSLQ